jgi:hypothetical protein
MTNPYLDTGFLITLLVITNGTKKANEVLRELEGPCRVTRLHELQVRTFLAQAGFLRGAENQKGTEEGKRKWQWYLDEGIFEIIDLDWNVAFVSATKFVEEQKECPPAPLLILHPMLAAYSGSSHFLSFDPRSRVIARLLGLKVLPEKV